MKKINLILLMLVFAIPGILSQIPAMFNYQATLRDNSGQLLVSKEVSIKISIIQNNPSGTTVYSETHSVTTTSQGILNLRVGAGLSTDNFEDINWSAGPYFMKVELDAEGGNNYITMGTSEMSSVPYAINAKNAEKVEWNNVQNRPDFFSGNYYELDNLPLIPNNTNQLINGAGFLTTFSENDPFFMGSPSKSITNNNIANWNTSFAWGNHASAGYLTSNSTSYLTNKSGNVSMFANDMNYAVYPSMLNNSGRFLSTDGSIATWNYAVNTANSPLSISNNVINITQASATSSGYLSSSDWNLFFNKAPSPWERNQNDVFFKDGKVGIGTTNPDRILHVESYVPDGQFREMVYIRNLSSSNSAYTGLNLRADDYNYGLGISFTSSNYNLINDFNQVAFLNTNGRAFAISCSSPEGSIRLFTNMDGSGIVERMRIISNGNVGFNTINPKAKIEVADGDIYISTINKGVIMKSPNGQCWRGIINNTGNLEFSAVPCP